MGLAFLLARRVSNLRPCTVVLQQDHPGPTAAVLPIPSPPYTHQEEGIWPGDVSTGNPPSPHPHPVLQCASGTQDSQVSCQNSLWLASKGLHMALWLTYFVFSRADVQLTCSLPGLMGVKFVGRLVDRTEVSMCM